MQAYVSHTPNSLKTAHRNAGHLTFEQRMRLMETKVDEMDNHISILEHKVDLLVTLFARVEALE